MEAIEFAKQYKRICKIYSNNCSKCPMFVDGCGMSANNIERIIQIVEDWVYTHPQKTMMQDFFEKFPNAPKTLEGTPRICPSECGYEKINSCSNGLICDALKCWNRPLGD